METVWEIGDFEIKIFPRTHFWSGFSPECSEVFPIMGKCVQKKKTFWGTFGRRLHIMRIQKSLRFDTLTMDFFHRFKGQSPISLKYDGLVAPVSRPCWRRRRLHWCRTRIYTIRTLPESVTVSNYKTQNCDAITNTTHIFISTVSRSWYDHTISWGWIPWYFERNSNSWSN